MTFLDNKSKASDEVGSNLAETISISMFMKLQDEDCIVDVLETKRNDYPALSKVAMHIFSTPTASLERDWDFSSVEALYCRNWSNIVSREHHIRHWLCSLGVSMN